jgi:uncharacterized protein YjiS (DUF1127 family)
MAVLEDGQEAGGLATGTRPGVRPNIFRLLRLWRARHRHRRELAMMSARDCRDARIARDLAAYEAGRWPWQKWNPEWQELDAVLLGVDRCSPLVHLVTAPFLPWRQGSRQ